jgi:uncharacterized protein involved in exopolysaccharide biosynthesis
MRQNNLDEEITLKELIVKIKTFLTFFSSKKKLILFFLLIGSLLGYIYSSKKVDLYVAELTFTIESDKPMYLGGSLASILGFDLGGANESGVYSSSNIIELFKSRKIIEKVLLTTTPFKPTTFAENYCENHEIKINNSVPSFFKKETLSRRQDSILNFIYNDIKKNYLKIEELNSKSSIIKLEMKSRNENFAKHFIETLVKVVSTDYNELKTKKSRLNMIALQNQVDSVRLVLTNKLNSIGTLENSKMNTIEIEINSKLLLELVKQSELEKFAVRKDTPFIEVIDNPKAPLKLEHINNFKHLILGGALGLMISIFLIFTLYFLKKFNA